MKLSHWPKFQTFYPKGLKLTLFSLYGQRFPRYWPIFKNCHNWTQNLAVDLLVFKVILGSFGALFSKWPVIQTQVSVENSGVKFGSRG